MIAGQGEYNRNMLQYSQNFYDIGSAEGHECPDLQVGDEVNPRTFCALYWHIQALYQGISVETESRASIAQIKGIWATKIR